MTPREKAMSLYESFYPQVQWKMGQEDCKGRSKQCALIVVGEIIDSHQWQYLKEGLDYWQEVKQELDKL